jgi:triphosphatase
MDEFELKFEIPASSLKRLSAAVHSAKPQLQMLRACYFDTADGMLAANGLVLRMRKEDNCWVQTAKGITDTPLERLEHNVRLAKSKSMPSIDLSRHEGELVGKKIAKALKLKSSSAKPKLIMLYETDVQRLMFLVAHAGSVMEIALDQGMVVNGARSVALRELEIELKSGKAEHAVELARLWCKKYGLCLSTITKSMKGQRLRDTPLNKESLKDQALNSQQNTALFAIAPKFKRHVNAHQIMKAILQSCLNQVLANASEIVNGSRNTTHVHQLRVGIRRLRTALSELKMLANGINPAWGAPLIKVFRILGQHRDAEYLAINLQAQITAVGGSNVSSLPTNTKNLDLSSSVQSPVFQDTLLGLIAYVHGERLNAHVKPNTKELADDSPKNVIAKRLNKQFNALAKQSKKFIELDETKQHSLRKQFKSLRYLAEFSASLFHKHQVKNFIEALKPVQDALGFYNDELMALKAYHKMANKNKQAMFAIGWLTARRLPNVQACQNEINIFINKYCRKPLFWQ